MALQSLTPVICHTVFILCAHLYCKIFIKSLKYLAFEGQSLKYLVNMLTTENCRHVTGLCRQNKV